MPETPEIPEASADLVKIGTIGTIGSLMSKEMDSINSLQSCSSFQKKSTSPPLSAAFVSAPKSTKLSGTPYTEPSNSDNHGSRHIGNAEKLKKKVPENGQRTSILRNEPHNDKKMRRNMANKKGRTCLVEIVDIKCNNPMSNRLKKLGFSKLSETIG